MAREDREYRKAEQSQARVERSRNQGDREVREPVAVERQRGRDRGALIRPGLAGPWDPFRLMDEMREEMDRIFGNFFGTGLAPARSLRRTAGDIEVWAPQIEMFERDGKLVVQADLPGMKKDDVNVEIENDILTIEGERREERSDEEGGYSERRYGRFYRAIPLPDGVNAENTRASFNDGVLEVTIDAPRREQQQRRRVEIESGRK